jgi:hypothetical protein
MAFLPKHALQIRGMLLHGARTKLRMFGFGALRTRAFALTIAAIWENMVGN